MSQGISAARFLRVTMPLVVLGTLIFGTPVQAQDQPFRFIIGAGPIMPSGDVGDNFDTGFTVPVGVGWRFTENLEVDFEYMYGTMNGPSATVPNQDPLDPRLVKLNTDHSIHTGTFNVRYATNLNGPLQVYGIAGPGFYHRRVALTTPDIGLITICNPWWWICTPGAVPVTRILGTRSTTDFGFNVGAGVQLGTFFVEVRYHYANGPEIEIPDNVPSPTGERTVKANGHYVPVNFGFRF